MSTTPTIYQYMLNLFVNARIKTAEASGDAKAIARAHAAYDNISESEVTFSKFVKNTATGKWTSTITSKVRGWTGNINFNTGTLKALIGDNLQGVGKLESLVRMVDFPGLFFVDETQALYLVVEKDANIFEALKMSGYEFPTDTFNVILKKDFDPVTHSDGFVDIDHPIVTGRLLLSYIRRTPAPSPKEEETDKEKSKEVSGEEPELSEEEQIQAMLDADKAQEGDKPSSDSESESDTDKSSVDDKTTSEEPSESEAPVDPEIKKEKPIEKDPKA